MKGLMMMLRALGIEITDADAAAITAVIPTIPARLNQASEAINKAIVDFDARLAAIELVLYSMIEAKKLEAENARNPGSTVN